MQAVFPLVILGNPLGLPPTQRDLTALPTQYSRTVAAAKHLLHLCAPQSTISILYYWLCALMHSPTMLYYANVKSHHLGLHDAPWAEGCLWSIHGGCPSHRL